MSPDIPPTVHSDLGFTESLVVWLTNVDNLFSLTGSAISTLIGALFAFWVGMWLYRSQQRTENLGYLQYAISSLSAVMSGLYDFKAQIVIDRHAQALDIVEQRANPQPDAQGVAQLNMDKIWKTIQIGGFHWPVSIEKLSIIATRDPNVIQLLGIMESSLKALNGIILESNEHVKIQMAASSFNEIGPLTPESNTAIDFQISVTKCLHDQTDSTLYLVEKCIELLIQYGWLEFCGGMKIKSHKLAHESYEALKPAPTESWENNKWFPQKGKPHQRVWRRVKRRANCFLGRDVE